MIVEILILMMATIWELGTVLPSEISSELASECPESSAVGCETWIMDQLLSLAGEEGYLEARMDTSYSDGETVYSLIPGRPYTIARLVVDGYQRTGTSPPVQTLENLEGSVWNAGTANDVLQDLLNWYEDNGYPFASVDVRHVAADSATGSLSIRFALRTGPATTLEDITVTDSIRTKPRVIARLAGLSSGIPYSQSAIDQARRRLVTSGFFTRVNEPILRAGSTPDRVVVHMGLAERTFHAVTGAVGLSREGTVTGRFDVVLRNIAGTARTAEISWEGSDQGYNDMLLRYGEPWLFGLPPRLEVEVQQTVEDTLWVVRQGHISLQWDLGGGVSGRLGYSGRRVIPGEYSDITATRSNEGWGELHWDRELRFGMMRQGYGARLRSGYESRKKIENGETEPAVRIELDFIRHVPLFGNIALSFQGSWRRIISDADELPLPERYPLGGSGSVRGYRERQFRSRSAGWLNGELSMLLDRDSSLFLFFDSGAYEDAGSAEWIWGTGIGLRAQTALGILRAEYGIPRGTGPLDGRIHMAIDRDF